MKARLTQLPIRIAIFNKNKLQVDFMRPIATLSDGFGIFGGVSVSYRTEKSL